MRIVLGLFLVLYISVAQAQISDRYPDSYTLFFNNIYLINPAFVPEEGKAFFTSAYKMRTGAFSQIATFSISGERLIRMNNLNVHAIRGFFFNEKTGPYITSPRAYFSYAYSLKIKNETNLSAGLNFGMAGLSFSAPTSSGSARSQVPDGAIGIMLQNPDLSGGISVQQIFNSVATPLGAENRFGRFYSIFLSGKKEISSQLTFRTYFLANIYHHETGLYALSGDITFADLFSIGSGYQYDRGASIYGRLHLNLGEDQMIISAGTFSSFGKNSYRGVNLIELSINYVLN